MVCFKIYGQSNNKVYTTLLKVFNKSDIPTCVQKKSAKFFLEELSFHKFFCSMHILWRHSFVSREEIFQQQWLLCLVCVDTDCFYKCYPGKYICVWYCPQDLICIPYLIWTAYGKRREEYFILQCRLKWNDKTNVVFHFVSPGNRIGLQWLCYPCMTPNLWTGNSPKDKDFRAQPEPKTISSRP